MSPLCLFLKSACDASRVSLLLTGSMILWILRGRRGEGIDNKELGPIRFLRTLEDDTCNNDGELRANRWPDGGVRCADPCTGFANAYSAGASTELSKA